MTYGELLTSLARLAIRSDLTADWPEFVRSAHDVIVDQIALVSDLTLVSAEATLPTDFSRVVSVWSKGSPRAWSVDVSTITAAVDASEDQPAKLVYRPAKAFFADESATNTVLTDYPWVYRYGALAAAGRFMRDGDLANTNEGLFRGEITRIAQASAMAAAEDIAPSISQPTP